MVRLIGLVTIMILKRLLTSTVIPPNVFYYFIIILLSYNNNIFYTYKKNDTQNFGATLLDKIEYNNDKTRKIKFIYEDSNRSDITPFILEGNFVKLSTRLKWINITINDSVVRLYEFNYFKNTTSSLLSNFTEYGFDGLSRLPSSKFNYYPEGDGFNNITGWTFPSNIFFQRGHISGGITQGLRLGDLNRDGLPDLVISQCSYIFTSGNCSANNVERKVFINTKTGWVQDNSWVLPESSPFANVPVYEPTGTQLEDINGDGLADIVQMYANPDSYPPHDIRVQRLWLNNGTAFVDYTANWTFPQNEYFFSTDYIQETGLRIIDLNGDGLPDLAKSRCPYATSEHCYTDPNNVSYDQKVWINNGTGWTNNTYWKLPPKLSFITADGGGQYDPGVRFGDVNGDFLTDIVAMYGLYMPYPQVPVLTQQLWLNNGSGFVNYTANWTFPDREYITITSASFESGIQLMDVNSDGRADLVKSGCIDTSVYFCHITPGANHQDVWINTGQGWFNGTNWKVPSSMPFIQYTTFSAFYHDMGTRFADLNGDGSIDILRMYISDPDTNAYQIQEAWLNNGSKFLLLKNYTNQFGGKVLVDYQPSTLSDNKGSDNLSDIGFNIMVVSNITEDNGMTTSHNTNLVKKFNYTSALYEYNSKEFRGFGEVTEIMDNKKILHKYFQDISRQGKEFNVQIFDNQSNLYFAKDLNWNTTNLSSYFVINLIEESEKTYDNLTVPRIKNVTYGHDSFGNVISVHNLGDVQDNLDDKYEFKSYATNSTAWIINKMSNHTILDYDGISLVKSTIYSYDNLQFGVAPILGGLTNREELLSANNKRTTNYSYNSFGNLINETDPNGNVLSYIYGLRDPTNTFVETTINAKNQKIDYGYNKGTGNILSMTDYNGLITNYTYDQFGRKIKEIKPYDSFAYPSMEVNYSMDGIAPEVTLIQLRNVAGIGDTTDSYEIIDGLGKTIQTRKEDSGNKQIITDTFYNQFGGMSAQSNPYYSNFSSDYSSPNLSIPLTNYTHDSLDRIIRITNPDKTFKIMSYTRWNLSIFDEKGNRKDNLLDAYNKIIIVNEYLNYSKYSTIYYYNALNSLISITDSLNNSINYSYDLLGRKVNEKDPDRGIWNYTYDHQGNIIKVLDNKNISVDYSYDQLNRKVNETSNGLAIIYNYDKVLNLTLSDVRIENIIFNYTYDNRLRKTREDKNITDKKYSLLWSYDSADRVTSQIMPDGRTINLTYDSRGMLSEIQGISNFAYNEKGNPSNITYANNVATNYSYNSSNLRVIRIKTSNKQELNYQYDSVGNILSINDSVHSVKYEMSYDSLNRLTSTTITGSFGVLFGFIYDQIGNIRNVTGTYATDYYYQDSRPHATSRVVFY